MAVKPGHKLKVSENRTLRRISGSKWRSDEAWRNLNKDKNNNVYSSLDIIRIINQGI